MQLGSSLHYLNTVISIYKQMYTDILFETPNLL